MASQPTGPAIKILTAAQTALELARDCLAEIGRPKEAAEAVDLTARLNRLLNRLRRRK